MGTETNLGKVKFFNQTNGFGFITNDGDEKEIFFHVSGTLGKIVTDDKVSFNIEEGDRGPKAVNVKRIE